MNRVPFDATGVGIPNGNFFGFPWTPEESDVVIVTVPWDATTSYRRGTSRGPEAMVRASTQLDFYSFDNPGASIVRCGTDSSLCEAIGQLNKEAGEISTKVIEALEHGIPEDDPTVAPLIQSVNEASEKVEFLVYNLCEKWIKQDKRVLLAGGEHSVPLGFLKALGRTYNHFGILQIDAHADLRAGFEGFGQSHASIMYNALTVEQATKIVQVGIRDVSEPEMTLAQHDPRIRMFSDHDIKTHQYCGGSWFEKCLEIVGSLPELVYVSFDIDGLEPAYCPNTGTPVPGGLTPDAVLYLVRMVAESGRRIIGADLCEVAPGPDDRDGNTGARILYRLAVLMRHSNYPT